jgi:tetrapyrrole methylase family protein/MazG family protein
MVYDITLAGIGIGGFDLVTLETVKAFESARVIFDFTWSHQKRLKEYGKPIIRLDDSYWSGDVDENVYRKLANIVLEEARKGPGIVYVEDGHPAFFDNVTWDVYRRGKKRGLKVRILPAISCLDSMIAKCGLEIDSAGFQVFEATSLVAYNQKFNPNVDMLIMQIGWFATSLLFAPKSNKAGRFKPLIDYLRRFYPADHPVTVMRAPGTPREEALALSTQLSGLDRHRRRIASDSCLYVPGLGLDLEENEEFIAGTLDKEHLLEIAEIE